MWNLKYNANELIQEIDSQHREQTYGCQTGEKGEGERWAGSLGLADANYYI